MSSRLDKIDFKILAALQNDARITNLALSGVVSLSPSACLARVQKLRETGVISHDMCMIAPSKIGPALHAILEITLANHTLADHVKFENSMRSFDRVTMAIKVSGRFDYLLAVTVADMPELNSLSDELLGGDIGISKLVTVPILDIAKPFKGFPLVSLG